MINEEMIEKVKDELPSLDAMEMDRVKREFIDPLRVRLIAICQKADIDYTLVLDDGESTGVSCGITKDSSHYFNKVLGHLMFAHSNNDLSLLMRMDAVAVNHLAEIQLVNQISGEV